MLIAYPLSLSLSFSLSPPSLPVYSTLSYRNKGKKRDLRYLTNVRTSAFVYSLILFTAVGNTMTFIVVSHFKNL